MLEGSVSLSLAGTGSCGFAQGLDTPGTPSREPGDAIKVCVRVRPLSKSELDNGEKMCVRILPEMPYSTTVNLTNPADTGPAGTRAFSFDRAYWSAKDADSHYVSQAKGSGSQVGVEKVWRWQEHLMDDLGHELRSNVPRDCRYKREMPVVDMYWNLSTLQARALAECYPGSGFLLP
ncbi:kif1 [Symbiodinium natans]|uniref:Kif1 protein n=1 Tax=Symbiodinium natans TaxID=878477 RepID=A0A812I098_9DINO|nr:kif1 [Symbiodinium natans]